MQVLTNYDSIKLHTMAVINISVIDILTYAIACTHVHIYYISYTPAHISIM